MRPANRAGLAALRYRLGDRRGFLASMLDRLSSTDYPALAELTTRDVGDPAIALLDGWASLADVLTFYQERIANEGFLRTATERRSVLELARLVGYQPRPGVAAAARLAFTLEDGHDGPIPAGTKVQSVPGPGELPQVFETSEGLQARATWNLLQPRMERPVTIVTEDGINPDYVWVRGLTTAIQPGDPLLFELRDLAADAPDLALKTALAVEPDPEHDRTRVAFTVDRPPAATALELDHILDRLTGRAPIPAVEGEGDESNDGGAHEGGDDDEGTGSDDGEGGEVGDGDRTVDPIAARFIAGARPELARAVWQALRANAEATAPRITVYAFRETAHLYGHNAPLRIGFSSTEGVPKFEPAPTDWRLADDDARSETDHALFLDGEYPRLASHDPVAPSYVLLAGDGPYIEPPSLETRLFRVEQVEASARNDYGTAGKVTRVGLDKAWRPDLTTGELRPELRVLRGVVVHLRSEPLELANEPIDDCIAKPPPGGGTPEVELDGVYDGLEPGRQVIVSGEREDLPGVTHAERAEIVDVDHRPGAIGDTRHTFVELTPLAHCYRRATVRIHGNVAHATHGEIRIEVLGSGDGTQTLQRFTLKQKPLTYTSAATETGLATSLRVEVDEVAWPEAPSVATLGPDDRRVLTQRAADESTDVVFGTGWRGARLPTGRENVRATYRSGLGKAGNVAADQLSQLLTRPLGVTGAVNPLPARGGADPDSRDQAKDLVPRSLRALGRAVSETDHEDFAALFAGVGKADATRLATRHGQYLHVTVAGVDDIPLDGSDVVANLRTALSRLGDASVRLIVAVRVRRLLVVRARVAVGPDRTWEAVRPRVATALADRFGFDRRQLGHGVARSDVLATIQAVPGVDWVALDLFGAVADDVAAADIARQLANPPPAVGRRARYDWLTGAVAPAELVVLDQRVPGTLTLEAGSP